MRITTKGRYALRAVLALAASADHGKPTSIKTISEKEDISAEFLEQIFFKLRKADIIGSVRGPGGGFYFKRKLEEITLLEILEASGEGLGISPCVCGKKLCDRKPECIASKVWNELDSILRTYAGERSIADMLN